MNAVNLKIFRAISSGIFVWILIFISFTVMSFIPVIKNSELHQNVLASISLIPFATLGAILYYRKGNKTNGFIIGVIMTVISLVLDALITVPYVTIPHGGGYASFYSSPFLWILALEFITIIYFYWKVKVKPESLQKIKPQTL